MKQIRLFGSIASAMLLGLMALTSCVQTDFYDDLYDEDLSSGTFINRRKYKEIGHDFFQDYAHHWVNNSTDPAKDECVALCIANYKYSSRGYLPQVRNSIGLEVYRNTPSWESSYYSAVVFEGGLRCDAKSVVGNLTGTREYATSEWSSLFNRDESNGHLEYVPNRKVIVRIDNYDGSNHWGLLERLIWENPLTVVMTDQKSSSSRYKRQLNQIILFSN